MTSYLELILDIEIAHLHLVLFLISLAACIVLTYLKPLGFNGRAFLDLQAVQSAHSGYVPRIGGIGIYTCHVIFNSYFHVF